MVLKSPDIPSMLVETAYISNPAEEQRLRGLAHQAKLAAAIHQGLREYFYADPPAGTRDCATRRRQRRRPMLATRHATARQPLTLCASIRSSLARAVRKCAIREVPCVHSNSCR